MRKTKGTPQQRDAPRRAGFWEASSGTISLHGGSPGEDGSRPRLQTVCFGRMPEAGKVSLKEDVVAEVRARTAPSRLAHRVHRRRRPGQLGLLLCIDLSTAPADNGPSLLRNPDRKGIERRWITLLSAGWLPPDFTSSWSCLTLGSWVARPCGRVHIGASRVLRTGLRRPGFLSRDTLHILGSSRRIRRLHASPGLSLPHS